jgi:Cd2+/Zn2+-exporting ATPase
MEELGVESATFHAMATRLEDAGHSLVAIGNEKHVCGLISLADSVRPVAPAVVRALKRLGIAQVVMLSGDNQGTAQAVATTTGVDACWVELLPEDRVRLVAELGHRCGPVAMVGDGVNDAPAMAAATIGIAMGAMGSDAAIETADIALMADELRKLPWLIRLYCRLQHGCEAYAYAVGTTLNQAARRCNNCCTAILPVLLSWR